MKVFPEGVPTVVPQPGTLASRGTSPASVELKGGCLHRLQILKVEGQSVLVILGEKVLKAYSTIPLEEGQELWAKMFWSGERIILKVVDSEEPSDTGVLTPLLRRALPCLCQGGGRSLTKSFWEGAIKAGILRGPLFGAGEKVGVAEVLMLLKGSGLFLENKLLSLAQRREVHLWPDAKADLLRILAQGEAHGELLDGARGALSLIEAFQALACLGTEKAGAILVFPLLPWFLPEGLEGKIRFFKPPVSRQNLGDSQWAVVVDLEEAAVGRIVVRISLAGQALRCIIWASLTHVREWIHGHLGELREMLFCSGVKEVHCSIEPMAETNGIDEVLEGVEGMLEVIA